MSVAERDVFYVSDVAAPHLSIAPTLSLASSDILVIWSLPDALAALPVVLPPDVMGGDVHMISDPCVFTVRCFLPPLMVDRIYIYMGSGKLIILLLFWTIVHCRFCVLSFFIEPTRTPAVGVPAFPGGSTVEA